MKELEQILKRFNVIYGKLVKKSQKLPTLPEQLVMCQNIAKGESIAIQPESHDEISALISTDIGKIVLEHQSLHSHELFFKFFLLLQLESLNPKIIFQLYVLLMSRIQSQTKTIKNDQINSEENDNVLKDASVKADPVIPLLLELLKVVIKKLLKCGENVQIDFFAYILNILQNYIHSQEGQYLHLEEFIPISFNFKVLEFVLKSKHLIKNEAVLKSLDHLQNATFGVFQILNRNSKYFIVNILSSKQDGDRQVRRKSVLFTEILELLLGFSCLYLKMINKLGLSNICHEHSLKLWNTLFVETPGIDLEGEYFTLRERVKILGELNTLFIQIPIITEKKYYWRLIQDALSDNDNYCRKVGISVLKNNINALVKPEIYTDLMNKQEFELLWTTFFDLFDTLESFGSHLTKAVWDRAEVMFQFIQRHYSAHSHFHPLVDFRDWLFVLYRRISSHNNLKIRKYVQKATLKRKYMTTHMKEYLFDELLKSLNKGMIFKDSNLFTQFSKNNILVIEFYERYFASESNDISGDLKLLFQGFVDNVNHPQMILSILKTLSKLYLRNEGQNGFIGTEELQKLNQLISIYFMEQQYSNKYMCFKYILQMVAHYFDQNQIQTLDWSQFFKVIGKMPLEFFSEETISVDKEAIAYSEELVEKIGVQNIRNVIISYINDAILIKAMVQTMPKFGGSDMDLILQGVSKMLLILAIKGDNDHYQWFQAYIKQIWEGLAQILNSQYLSPEVGDSKVKYMASIMNTVYRYASPKHKQIIRLGFIENMPMIIDRFNDHLVTPTVKYELIQHQLSDRNKLHSAFSYFNKYVCTIKLGIWMNHIHLNQANSPLERQIQIILQNALKITSQSQEKEAITWGSYILEYSIFKSLKSIMKCYSEGIKECLKKGIQYFFIPEDIFTFGKPLLQNLLEYQQVRRLQLPEINESAATFEAETGISLSYMNQKVLLDQWKIIASLISIFQFEAQMKSDLLVLYPVISEKAIEFLSRSTDKFYTPIFKILKYSYLPMLIMKLQSGDQYKQEEAIVQFQDICLQCWRLLKEQNAEFDLESLQLLLEIAFSPELLEIYLRVLNPIASQNVREFHNSLAKELFDHGNRFWLILRTSFNHLMLIFVQKPYLIQSFEQFVLNFAISREVRSSDSEIKLYKMSTLIPQVFKKDYESLNLEEITYQGAYIRTMTIIIIEELIKSHVKSILEGNAIQQNTLEFIESMEQLILMCIDVNLQPKMEKPDMPYTEKHRIKVRLWQFMLVCLQLLDPQLYTPEFRKLRLQQSNRDIISEVNARLWRCTSLGNIPSIRQYTEIFAIRFINAFPNDTINDPMFVKTLLDPNLKPQVASSFLMIAGLALTKNIAEANAVSLKQKIYENIAGFMTSNSAHIRCLAQYFIYVLQHDPQFSGFIPSGMQPILKFLEQNRDCQKMLKKYKEDMVKMEYQAFGQVGSLVTLCTPLDQYGEFMSVPFVEQLKDVTSEVISEIRRQDNNQIKIEDLWKIELESRKEKGDFKLHINEESSQNYQRKILPWEQIEYDFDQLKRIYDNRVRNDVIMCASLIDKIPNLGGLARTSEIMNASALVVNNKAVCDSDEFRGVSVTSEKWLPIYEVREKDLANYLEFQKSNGYKILGLEQTANSKMLNDFTFPSKCVLLLGKEKEGIPQEYLHILDECIEIPQFGIIRSLNVHVSGALCLWEYTKQHIPKKLTPPTN